jgi:O-antigen/teichoic acid export membrane protein
MLDRLRANIERSPAGARVARGALWSLIGGVGSRVLAVGGSVLVARLLGKVGYGEMGMVQSTVGMLGVFAGFGLGTTATKCIAEYRRTDPGRAGRIAALTLAVSLLTTGILAGLCAVCSGWLAQRALGRAALAPLVAAGALQLVVTTLAGVVSSALAGFEEFRRNARMQLWLGILGPFITVPMVWRYGVDGAVAAVTINAALGLAWGAVVLGSAAAGHAVPLRYDRECWREAGVLVAVALPSLLSSVLLIPVMWVTNLMLVRGPGGYGELGIFNAANQWRMVIVLLPGMLASAVLPVLAETHGSHDHAGFRSAFVLNLRATLVIAFPLTVLTVVLAGPVAALFGRQYAGMEFVLPALMVAAFLSIVNATIGAALVGAGRLWTGTLMNLAWAVALVGAAAYLVPRRGAFGLGVAYLAAYLLHTLWQMAYVELRIAPAAILGQWRLLVLMALVIAACLGGGGARERFPVLVGVGLTAAAALPLLGMARKAVRA